MTLVSLYHGLIWGAVIAAAIFYLVSGFSQMARERRRYVRRVKK